MAPNRAWADCRSQTNELLLSTRAGLRAVIQDRNSLALRAGALTPSPFYACSSKTSNKLRISGRLPGPKTAGQARQLVLHRGLWLRSRALRLAAMLHLRKIRLLQGLDG